jgi:23S rRNA G2445 N2-methylase RlmL
MEIPIFIAQIFKEIYETVHFQYTSKFISTFISLGVEMKDIKRKINHQVQTQCFHVYKTFLRALWRLVQLALDTPSCVSNKFNFIKEIKLVMRNNKTGRQLRLRAYRTYKKFSHYNLNLILGKRHAT